MYFPVTKDFWNTETLMLKWFNQNEQFMITSTVLQTLINNKEKIQRKNSRTFSMFDEALYAKEYVMIIDPKGEINETMQKILENARRNKMNFTVIQIDNEIKQ